jgi:hypothetical protein
MEIKVKPVQPSEIKDRKIALQAIAEARREPTAEDWARMEKLAECFKRLQAK